MSGSQLLIVLLVAAWLAAMGLAASLQLRPQLVRLVRPLVCPPGAELVVETFAAGYYARDERGISIYYRDERGRERSVKARALLALWGILLVVALPIAAGIVLVGASLLG